jgi:hypothetical protein
MQFSRKLRRVALVRADVSKESTIVLLTKVLWLLVIANLPSSPILVNLMLEALSFSETSAWPNIPEGGILHSHRRENIKSLQCYLCCGPTCVS